MTNDPTGREPFLGRWARRKEAQRREAEASASPEPSSAEHEPTEPVPHATETAAPAEGEAAPLTDADMPDIDSLAPDSDVSGFFSPGVSEALRRKALRKLFHTARFNVKDGLDDYDEDYTQLQSLGNVETWDMKRQQQRLAERRERRERLEAEAGAEDEGLEPVSEQPDALDDATESSPMDDSHNPDIAADQPADEEDDERA
ncbi:DUF3306 domain-containing protein [Spiribacter pallidus]|jgi:hypothetical protein|uniref:DUF3306 domain-containing protein n=1 Tax=Spiribacter pallidus TaxID=1987936 RepID=A0ABV3TD62_9GAMM